MRKTVNLHLLTMATAACVTLLIAAKPAAAAESCTVDAGIVSVTKSVPNEAALNQQYTVNLEIRAAQQAADIKLTDQIPAGASYVSSNPAATRQGDSLVWTFPQMTAGATQPISVVLKADREGDLTGCTTITAVPQCCVSTMVGKPAITITKTGPAQAQLGQDVTYTIVISNPGTAVATGVAVTDNVPAGLTHSSGQQTLTYNVGDLPPNASREFTPTFKAAKRGRVCNPAVVNTTNAGTATAEACTVIVEPQIKIAKSGLEEQFLNKVAGYTITVNNPGDVDLTNVVVTDSAPSATRIVDAPGARVAGNTATWTIPTLKAGGREDLKLSLTTSTAGTHCNEVSVASDQGLSGSARACTLWRGYPALLLEVIDTVDPLLVDEETTYIIRVTNQGTARDTQVRIDARFPAEISPLSGAGSTQCTVQGKKVSAAPYAVLEPKQAIEWTVKAKAAQVGDSRLFVDLYSDLLKTPVTEEESTHVY